MVLASVETLTMSIAGRCLVFGNWRGGVSAASTRSGAVNNWHLRFGAACAELGTNAVRAALALASVTVLAVCGARLLIAASRSMRSFGLTLVFGYISTGLRRNAFAALCD